jgi:hypothetical protein
MLFTGVGDDLKDGLQAAAAAAAGAETSYTLW